MEIGSFFELQLPKGMEYYKGEKTNDMDIVRLNTGRAGIYHACSVIGCNTIWIPYYQCETVKDYLLNKGVNCKYYHIDSTFTPVDIVQSTKEAVLLVNYYGIMSLDRMKDLAKHYNNVIIDNSQAFFSKPIDNCMNVYSARKFIGAPDGAYVIGRNAVKGSGEYKQGFSSDTALFMLLRIEYGCEGKAYYSRMENEKRIESEDCYKMSKLTHALLDGTDYQVIVSKRRANFDFAKVLFETKNQINPSAYYDNTCVPMVYPFLMEDDHLLQRLLDAKHFQGHWWKWVEDNKEANDFEKWISRYMIPITIDQRYGFEELNQIERVVEEV